MINVKISLLVPAVQSQGQVPGLCMVSQVRRGTKAWLLR